MKNAKVTIKITGEKEIVVEGEAAENAIKNLKRLSKLNKLAIEKLRWKINRRDLLNKN
jgi:hypothetical protein